MTQEWALWQREDRESEWKRSVKRYTQHEAMFLAVNANSAAADHGMPNEFSATPADERPPSLERDPQVTLGPRLCLALGGVCKLDAGHEGEHQP